MTQKLPLVAVVDDDESIRESLPDLLREFGFDARAFASAEDFLGSADLGRTACLVLDVAMPGMNGPELLRELRRRGMDTPVVFITAHVGDATRPELLKAGAVECLFKPFSETSLLGAIKTALRAA
jgi:FixJ family two-component response regulator